MFVAAVPYRRRSVVLVTGLALAVALVVGVFGVRSASAGDLAFDCSDPGYLPGDLQVFIDTAADPGDTILVASGVCTENLYIDKDLTIQGAGAFAAVTTTIDGDHFLATVTTEEHEVGPDVAVNLLDMIVINGGSEATRALRHGPAPGGAGVSNWGADVFLDGVWVYQNGQTGLPGSGVYNTLEGTTTITSSEISFNHSDLGGAGIYNGFGPRGGRQQSLHAPYRGAVQQLRRSPRARVR